MKLGTEFIRQFRKPDRRTHNREAAPATIPITAGAKFG